MKISIKMPDGLTHTLHVNEGETIAIGLVAGEYRVIRPEKRISDRDMRCSHGNPVDRCDVCDLFYG